jgi:hypothetical protein
LAEFADVRRMCFRWFLQVLIDALSAWKGNVHEMDRRHSHRYRVPHGIHGHPLRCGTDTPICPSQAGAAGGTPIGTPVPSESLMDLLGGLPRTSPAAPQSQTPYPMFQILGPSLVGNAPLNAETMGNLLLLQGELMIKMGEVLMKYGRTLSEQGK